MPDDKNGLQRHFLRCLLAVAATLFAFLCRQALVQYLGIPLPPFILFYPTVMIVALLAGLWPGLLCTAISALLAGYWIFPPVGQFSIAKTSDAIALGFFGGMGIFMSLVADRYRRSAANTAELAQALALKGSAEKLKQTEEEFESLANAIPQLAWMANPDGAIFWYNERWYSYTGSTPEQMKGWGWQSVHDPEALPHVLTRWQASISTGEPFDMVLPLKGADGAFRPFLTRVMPVKNEEGKVARWFGTNTEISEQKQAEQKLRKSEERYRNLFDAMDEGFCVIEMIFDTDNKPIDYRFLEVNRAFEKQTGLHDAVGKRMREFAPDHEEHWFEIYGKIALTGEPAHFVNEAKALNRYYDVHAYRVGDSEEGRVAIVFNDFSEYRRSEEELRTNRERLATIVNSAMDAIITIDANQRIIVFNPAAEKIFGCPCAEAMGQPLDRFIPPEFRQSHRRHVEDFGRTGVTARSMYSPASLHGLRASGEQFPIEATISKGAIGSEEFYTVILRDITERIQAERAKRESETAFEALANLVPQFVWICEPDGSNVYFNQRWVEYTGLPLEESYGKGWNTPFHPDDKQAAWDAWNHSTRTAEQYCIESRLRAADGSYRWFLMLGEPLKDDQGKVVRWFGTCTDIEDIKRVHEALRASEQRWATTLHSIGDAVISTDATGHVDYMNEVAEKLVGWSLAEAKGKELTEVFAIVQESSRLRPESPVAKVIRLGKVVGLANHTLLIRRDGTEVPIEDSAAPIRDREGKIEGVVLVFHDASEQRKIELVLRNNERLATTGRLAATIAHEIHNPLDSVGNLLYLIGRGTKEESTKEFIAEATRELIRVTQMTQQMLSFQREASKPISVNISEVLNSVVSLYERKLQSAGIQLRQEFADDTRLQALPGELRQVFANLFGNAIEAVKNHDGIIALHAFPSRNWRTGQPGVRVVVADNGSGIPAKVRERIFEPFFTTKGESGTGLGLWITSDILHKYQGTMRVRSSTREGRSGTLFSVFFPFNGDTPNPSS